MQFLDVAQRIRAFPHHAIDDRLVVEERERSSGQRWRPDPFDERRRFESRPRATGVDGLAENAHELRVRAAGRHQPQPIGNRREQTLRERVGERRRAGSQLTDIRRVAEKGRPDLLGQLEADLAQVLSRCGFVPGGGLGGPAAETARSDQHPVERRPVPQRAVVEHVTEGTDDWSHVVRAVAGDWQPVGRDSAFLQAIADERKVVARVQVHGAWRERRRRLARDQVVARARQLQELARVLEMHAHARIVQRVPRRRVNPLAHREDIRRDLHDVDRVGHGDVVDRAGCHAHPVAQHQDAMQRLVEQPTVQSQCRLLRPSRRVLYRPARPPAFL